MASPTLPTAKAFERGQRYSPARPPLRRRIEKLGATVRPHAEVVLSYAIGLFPLLLVLVLAAGLIWAAAVGNSP